jgi:hypothetical protein
MNEPPLELILHLRPSAVNLLIQSDRLIVLPGTPSNSTSCEGRNHDNNCQKYFNTLAHRRISDIMYVLTK